MPFFETFRMDCGLGFEDIDARFFFLDQKFGIPLILDEPGYFMAYPVSEILKLTLRILGN